MKLSNLTLVQLKKLLKSAEKLDFAMKNYPSRGQSAVQDLYQTNKGKLFLKRVSVKNHENCGLNPENGTLAEREFWAYCLAQHLNLNVPELVLLENKYTTVQKWLDLPDAHTYSSREGKLIFNAENVFECAIFDWFTGQVDRHDANYLYDYTRQKIILIDSSFCFLKEDGDLPHYLQIFEQGSVDELNQKTHSALLVRIKKTADAELFRLVPLKILEEREALLKRKERLFFVQSIQDVIHLYRGVKK